MRTMILPQIVKGILVIMLSAFLFIKKSEAQTIYSENQRDHLGLVASFGTRYNTISSNYASIDKMRLQEEGGSAGVVWGRRAFETKLMIGFYYSGSKVPHTTDLIEIETSANFYPLSLFTKKNRVIDPYFVGGVSKNYYRMYGYYAKHEPGPSNHSVGIEPYLGSMDVYMLSIGSGVAFNLGSKFQFIRLFTGARYSKPFASIKSTTFNDTHFSNQITFNVGVSFGMNL
ncbi:MAG: hypothetical protein ABI663_17215 [Chryseolinea sp.]